MTPMRIQVLYCVSMKNKSTSPITDVVFVVALRARLEGVDRDRLGLVHLRRLGGGEPGRLVGLQHAEVFGHVLDEGGVGRGAGSSSRAG